MWRRKHQQDRTLRSFGGSERTSPRTVPSDTGLDFGPIRRNSRLRPLRNDTATERKHEQQAADVHTSINAIDDGAPPQQSRSEFVKTSKTTLASIHGTTSRH
jgi:hypothetical protein